MTGFQEAVYRGGYLWPIGSESRGSEETKHKEETAEREALLYSESGKPTDTALGAAGTFLLSLL